MANFFYDNQIRRFLIQFAKIFSTWQVTKGKDPAGNDILVRVPVMYGDSSRQAATIIANNSASNLDRKSTRLNSSHIPLSRMPSSA